MSYYEQLQDLYRRYEKDGHIQPFTMHDLASWAYDNGFVPAPTLHYCEPSGGRVFHGPCEPTFMSILRVAASAQSTSQLMKGEESSLPFGQTSERPRESIWSGLFSRDGRGSLGIVVSSRRTWTAITTTRTTEKRFNSFSISLMIWRSTKR